VADTGGHVRAKAGTQQLPVHHLHMAVRGQSFTVAASLLGAKTCDGFGCKTSRRWA